ncbi:MAG: hypothetical protein MI810_07410 [Flavobacteriales bacterium]|nr:hypothetical protein [Flavobacteriales bacterium]
MISYTKISEVKISHSYFDLEMTYPIQLKLSAATEQWVSKYGFTVTYFRDNIIRLYTQNSGDLKDRFQYVEKITGENAFVFELVTEENSFYQYTDVPVNELGRLVFNSNEGTKVDEGQIDLGKGRFEQGEYTKLAIIRLYFKDILSTEIFDLSFTARKTQWNYYIINQSSLDLSEPEITGSEEVLFEGPEEVILPNKQTALLFSSGLTLIPLSYRPKYKFKLVNNQSGTGRLTASRKIQKTIFQALPNPDPMNLEIKNASNNGDLASPMYVYV